MPSNKVIAFAFAILVCASSSAVAQGLDPVFDDFERASLGPNWGITVSSTTIVNQSDLGKGVQGQNRRC